MCSTNREPGAWYPPVETAQLGPEESFPERPDLQRRDGHVNARMGVPLLCPSLVPGGSHGDLLGLNNLARRKPRARAHSADRRTEAESLAQGHSPAFERRQPYSEPASAPPQRCAGEVSRVKEGSRRREGHPSWSGSSLSKACLGGDGSTWDSAEGRGSDPGRWRRVPGPGGWRAVLRCQDWRAEPGTGRAGHWGAEHGRVWG